MLFWIFLIALLLLQIMNSHLLDIKFGLRNQYLYFNYSSWVYILASDLPRLIASHNP